MNRPGSKLFKDLLDLQHDHGNEKRKKDLQRKSIELLNVTKKEKKKNRVVDDDGLLNNCVKVVQPTCHGTEDRNRGDGLQRRLSAHSIPHEEDLFANHKKARQERILSRRHNLVGRETKRDSGRVVRLDSQAFGHGGRRDSSDLERHGKEAILERGEVGRRGSSSTARRDSTGVKRHMKGGQSIVNQLLCMTHHKLQTRIKKLNKNEKSNALQDLHKFSMRFIKVNEAIGKVELRRSIKENLGILKEAFHQAIGEAEHVHWFSISYRVGCGDVDLTPILPQVLAPVLASKSTYCALDECLSSITPIWRTDVEGGRTMLYVPMFCPLYAAPHACFLSTFRHEIDDSYRQVVELVARRLAAAASITMQRITKSKQLQTECDLHAFQKMEEERCVLELRQNFNFSCLKELFRSVRDTLVGVIENAQACVLFLVYKDKLWVEIDRGKIKSDGCSGLRIRPGEKMVPKKLGDKEGQMGIWHFTEVSCSIKEQQGNCVPCTCAFTQRMVSGQADTALTRFFLEAVQPGDTTQSGHFQQCLAAPVWSSDTKGEPLVAVAALFGDHFENEDKGVLSACCNAMSEPLTHAVQTDRWNGEYLSKQLALTRTAKVLQTDHEFYHNLCETIDVCSWTGPQAIPEKLQACMQRALRAQEVSLDLGSQIQPVLSNTTNTVRSSTISVENTVLHVPSVDQAQQVLCSLACPLPRSREKLSVTDNPCLDNMLLWVMHSLIASQICGKLIARACVLKQRDHIIEDFMQHQGEYLRTKVVRNMVSDTKNGAGGDNPLESAKVVQSIFLDQCQPLTRLTQAVLGADHVSAYSFDRTSPNNGNDVKLVGYFGDMALCLHNQSLEAVHLSKREGRTTIFRHLTEIDENDLLRENNIHAAITLDEPARLGDALHIFKKAIRRTGDDFLLANSDGLIGGNSDDDDDDDSSIGGSVVSENEKDTAINRQLETVTPFATTTNANHINQGVHLLTSSMQHDLFFVEKGLQTYMRQMEFKERVSLRHRRFWNTMAGITSVFVRRLVRNDDDGIFGMVEARKMIYKGDQSHDGDHGGTFTKVEAKFADAMAGLGSITLRNRMQLRLTRRQVHTTSLLNEIILTLSSPRHDSQDRLARAAWLIRAVLSCDRVTLHTVQRKADNVVVPLVQTDTLLTQKNKGYAWDVPQSNPFAESTHMSRALIKLGGKSHVANCIFTGKPTVFSVLQDAHMRPVVEKPVQNKDEETNNENKARYLVWSEICIPLFDFREAENKGYVVGVVQACNKIPLRGDLVSDHHKLPAYPIVDMTMQHEAFQSFNAQDLEFIPSSGIGTLLGAVIADANVQKMNPQAPKIFAHKSMFEVISTSMAIANAKNKFLRARQRARERLQRDTEEHKSQEQESEESDIEEVVVLNSNEHVTESARAKVAAAVSKSGPSNSKHDLAVDNSEKAVEDDVHNAPGIGASIQHKISPKKLAQVLPASNVKKLFQLATQRFQEDERLRKDRKKNAAKSRIKENRDWAATVDTSQIQQMAQNIQAAPKKSSQGSRLFQRVNAQAASATAPNSRPSPRATFRLRALRQKHSDSSCSDKNSESKDLSKDH